ncbi:GtrA family protein [Limosilactobacillus fermentum]|uniref:Membrane protein, GtrA family n=1 Tax=Furfurilactobacillus siliginis TaxID=348151 RepID=A0A510VR28_9LACO|nr:MULTISPECIES: GtrA family protein [Lactobacillaceae]MCS9984987.1 GtrA family protein [Weissella paramesenteroides]MCS9999114.1 GtrA family protein [Weissella paramesenteroides]MCT0259273.1 GtrA family protein [Weissella paramesenteroides]UXI99024.1 GtrA family protein [Lactiplantibacillus pentosus]GEK29407.1 membrane protein, GtrA family [Furfurilactobacillus siliginis]
MFSIFEKYKALILYGIFGVTTTIINVVSYALMLLIGINVQVAVVVSWLLAVIVAYLTNRVWVFNSGASTNIELLREFISFMLARLATLIVEMLIIWFGVQLLDQDPIIWKIIDNIVVIILNYVISKLIVFKNTRKI